MVSDNLLGADNQQERLDAYLAGFDDGVGVYCAVQRSPSTRLGWQLVPEFHVSQNVERRVVLDLLMEWLCCGRIQENHRETKDTSLVYVVRRRVDLLAHVIPFFEAEPLLSSKQEEFLVFGRIVRAMANGEHLTAEGFGSLLEPAISMNGGGRYRPVLTSAEASRILRDHMPNVATGDEDMVRSAWRHAESGRNDLAPGSDFRSGGNNDVGPYPV